MMKPNEIRAHFLLADITPSQLAAELGVWPPMIQQVIKNERPNPRIRQAIADRIVKRPVSDIWPDTKEKSACSEKS